MSKNSLEPSVFASHTNFRMIIGLCCSVHLAFFFSAGVVRADENTQTLLPAPIAPVPALLNEAAIGRAVASLGSIVEEAMSRTGMPGLAVGVVYKDKVIYERGFGVREVGKPGRVDVDTRFLLASVSKSIASTVIAKLVTDGIIDWHDKAKEHNPTFALSDPYVTEHATISDLLSHRSGLPTGAGDLLEDLGFDRSYILSHLDQQPLDRFRVAYHYSNFGFTSGCVAAAAATGKNWEDLAEEVLFKPAGMTSGSFRHADYLSDDKRAHIHKRLPNGEWAALYDRNPDAQSPAGGASASLTDIVRFLRLQLGDGKLNGRNIVDADALAPSQIPQIVSGPPSSRSRRALFYGLGWDVNYDDKGRVRLGHSGAFNLGTGTNITLLPGEDIGIAVLTNGQAIGVAEAVVANFIDVAQNGAQTVDWIGFLGGIFRKMEEADAPLIDYTDLPTNPQAAHDLAAYAGNYANSYYGPLLVFAENGNLSMTMGPQASPTTFVLSHFDADTFIFETIGENANGLAGAIFTVNRDGQASRVVLDFYDRTGLGMFIKE